MTIKVYISGICGSHEVRKQQQRVLFILQSMPIDLKVIDITEPGREEDLVVMQEGAKQHDKKTQLPPQIFNGEDYCGDYADFELANDDDQIMRFLKLEEGPSKSESVGHNGVGDHETNGVSNPLEEHKSNGITENNSEIINTESDYNETKDSETSENVENITAKIDESNEDASPGIEVEKESSEAEESE